MAVAFCGVMSAFNCLPTRQDVDISAQELENRTEAVALFLNRADTEASARDSIVTTCPELTLICVWHENGKGMRMS